MRRSVARFFACVTLVALLFAPVSVQGDALQLTTGGSRNGMMRVWLSSIRSYTSYNITVTGGTYTVNGQTLSSGSSIKVEFSGGTIYATINGTRQAMGTSVTLSRQSGGVRIAESLAPANTYPGDLRFFYSGSIAYVVCTLPMEEYLYGVLPYEMDNSFPLEALKAQAVAARTFAAFSMRSTGNYDVTDTVTYQVFRGVNTNNTRCIQAVDATRGQVMMYNGSFIEANFSASNGGQTETRYNAWGSSSVAYQVIQDDPYDLANPSSSVRSYTLYATPDNGQSATAYAMIQNALAGRLGGAASGYVIQEVTDVTPHTPKYASPSRVYTQLGVTVRYNGGMTTTVDIPIFSTVKTTLGLGINSTNNELLTVTRDGTSFKLSMRRFGHGVGLSQRGAQQMANQGLGYRDILGFYYPNVQLTQVDFTSSWGSGGSSGGTGTEDPTANATITLSKATDSLNIRREANASAAVLTSLPHGTRVTVTGESGSWYAVTCGNISGYASKSYVVRDVVPGPTGSGGTVGTARVSVQSGTLNLRASKSDSADILTYIPNGYEVEVFEKGDVWCGVRYGGQSGYVMTKFLTMITASPTPTPTAIPQQGGGTAVVTLSNTAETLNLRESPSTSSGVLAKLRNGAVLTVLLRDTTWTQVQVAGLVGYVMNTYVRYDGGNTATPTAVPTTPPATQTQYATVSVASGTLNLRASPNLTSKVVTTIPNGATVSVLQAGDLWYAISYAGRVGYVLRMYLKVENDTSPGVQPTPTPVPSAQAYATVRVASGTLNLRSGPSLGSSVVTTIPNQAQVALLSTADMWCGVRYGGYEGYVMRSYLSVGDSATPVPTPTPKPGGESIAATVSVNSGRLNLRSAPNMSAGILLTIPNRADVVITELGDVWCAVRYAGVEGYVMRSYLTLGTAVQPTSPPVSSTRTAWVNTKNGGSVNIRTSPSSGSSIVGTAAYGAQLQWLDQSGTWAYVQYGSITGYVAAEYLTETKPDSDVPAEDVYLYVKTRSGGTVNLRESASSSSKSLALLPHGTKLMLVEEGAQWTRVRYDKELGYVATEYLSTTPVP